MKTVIAVPDPVFARVEARVHALGWSRSEFYARAAERYLNQLDREDLTARLNAAIEAAGERGAAEQAEWAARGLESLDDAEAEDW